MSFDWNMPNMPYYFSTINRAMVSDNPWDSIGLSFALADAKMQAGASRFWVPNFSCGWDWGSYSIPFTGQEFRLDPNFTLWEMQNQMQNGGGFWGGGNFSGGMMDTFNWSSGMTPGMNGGFGGGFNGGFNGGIGGWPTAGGAGGVGGWPTVGSAGGSGGKTDEQIQQETEYKQYKDVLNQLKDLPDLDDTTKGIIKNALSKGGKIEDKLNAVKDAFNKIPQNERKQLIKNAVIKENCDELVKIGYDITSENTDGQLNNNTKTKKALEEYSKIKGYIDTIKSGIEQGNVDDSAITAITDTKYIMSGLSYWNDTYPDSHIIKYLGSKIGNDETANKKYQGIVNQMCRALDTKAHQVASKGNFTKLEAARKALSGKLDNLQATNESIANIAPLFDELYAHIRMAEAQLVRNKAYEKYGFLGADTVPADILVSETKQDLGKENIKVPSYDEIKPKEKISVTVDHKSKLDGKSAEEQKAGLVKDGTIKETECEGLYETNAGGAIGLKKYYTFADKDGKEVFAEVEGIQSVDEKGKINGQYNSLNDAIEAKAVTIKETTPTKAENYKASVTTIQEKDVVVNNDGSIKSQYKNADGEIEEYEINDDGVLTIKGNKTPVNADNIPIKATFINAKEERKEAAQGSDFINFGNGTYVTKTSDGKYKYYVDNTETTEDYFKANRPGCYKVTLAKQRGESFVTRYDNGYYITKTKENEYIYWDNNNKKIDRNTFRNKCDKINQSGSAYCDGSNVYKWVDGITTDSTLYTKIDTILNKITKTNVIDFLVGYYDARGNYSGDGIIEQLDDEYDGGMITMDGKKNLINAFIAAVKQFPNYINKNDSTLIADIESLEAILKGYPDNSDKTTFNNNSFLGYNSDNTKIDNIMKRILQKIQPQQSNSKSITTRESDFSMSSGWVGYV